MLRRRVACSYDERLLGFVRLYQGLWPGAVQMEHVAQWAWSEGLWEAQPVKPVTILTRDLKRAARKSRVVDPQGRKVRAMLPAKMERVDANGNRWFDVVWDHVFKMSDDHALRFLSQQYENIEKQCRSH